MMKRMMMIAAATLLSGAAVAQMPPPPPPGAPMPPPPGGWNRDGFWRGAPESPRERMNFLQARIDRGAADGSLDRREARNAQRDLNNVRAWARSLHWYDGGRLSPRDRDALQARLDQLSSRLHWMRHNGW